MSKYEALTDGELVMLFSRHDANSAFAELERRYSPLIASTCRQVTYHAQDAEDAAQATLLTLARRAPSLDRKSTLAGWLYVVAVRHAIKVARKRRQRRSEPLADDVHSSDVDPLHSVAVKELQSILHSELSRLPERYRNAILQCDIRGLGRTEAAATLDCTEASVKAALSRGRRELRRRLMRRGVALTAAVAYARSDVHAVAAQTRTIGPESRSELQQILVRRDHQSWWARFSTDVSQVSGFSVRTASMGIIGAAIARGRLCQRLPVADDQHVQ